MPAFEWVHVQLHQQKGMISLSPPTICNSAIKGIEVMRALRKGQASAFYYGDPLGEMRLVSRVFEM
ncbi:hypothetical protein C7D56_27575 (plasmid) [Salmonella enterica subsp. enterica serovar Corvallis]|nr:hypothetical protein C7D56_27575 [Salmonella enterica subsp. enterica serovar Corvallis]QAS87948.1 hypothetical protein C7V17_00935 [Escherichia coli]RFT85344.1 hypothetical protein D0X26_29940 [Escherichia coli]RXP84130.1 hypothetical protein D9K40_12935 [Escherichia coli]